jgi:hypothetical protein
MIKKLQIALLFCIPLLFLFFGLKFDRTKYGTDPESAYLMNGLNIATGKAVGHFDNPGTTVQVYSAVVLRITHLFRSSGNDLQTDVLLNSEYYIEVLRKGFIVLNAIVLLLLGMFTFVLMRNFWAGFLLQVAPFLSVTLIEECYTKVAPEPLLFAATAALIMLLLKYYFSGNNGTKAYFLWFGLLAGFGVATKMTFLPMLIIPFVVLEGKRNKWLYISAIVPSFVLFTLPAVKGYLSMAKWFLNLGTHTGTYGQGTSGIIDKALYFKSVISIFENNKSMIIVMILAAVALITVVIVFDKRDTKATGKEFRILAGLLLAQVGSILLVAKHYHSNHYLFPALSLTGFVILISYVLINNKIPGKSLKLFKFSLPVIVALLIGISALNIPTLSLAYKGYRLSNQSTDETFTRLDSDYKGFVKVFYYPVSFNVYSSLRWGNIYSKQYSTDKLMELFPEGLFYNAWDKSFQFWETNISTRAFIKKYGSNILLVGGPRTYDELKAVEDAGLKLKRLFESRVQVVYEIDTANSAMFKEVNNNKVVKWSLNVDFESFSPDGQWVTSGRGESFCKSSAIGTENARSGKHAVKLPVYDSYAMEYTLEEVKPGDMYELSIWRLGKTQDVFLVASAGPDDPFYQQSNGYVETDKRGWEKVILDFKIPESFKGNKLKVYLWNHSNIPVWFDDFQIDKYSE